ncbi:FG-GAP-like repeat-containing protein [Streptomyces hydrogenans]|uniref:FG-GAP-like repeat-containing protein n=1 Tax=Streptomyces hydrogenans TaxID=1873719 RepID=UPI00364831DE
MNRTLATTVALVLAVTAGGLTAPALAAAPRAAAPAATEAVPPLTVPADSELLSAGGTGMLTRTGAGTTATVYRWTRHADGATTVLPAGSYWGSPGTDVVVSRSGAVYTLTDMSGATEPVVIDTSALRAEAATYTLQRVVGRALLMKEDVAGVDPFHLVSLEDGRVVDREVAVPDGDVVRYNYSTGPGSLALFHAPTGSTTGTLSLVDPATGALTESYATKNLRPGSVALTPTHVAWVQDPYSSADRTLVLAGRGADPGPHQTLPLASPGDPTGTVLRSLGDWLLYTNPGGGTADSPSALHPLTARSAKTGESFPLLDHAGAPVPDADGGLLVLGGTLDRGEGLYRIAPDAATGKPTATLVRTSGQPTALTVVKETLPPTGTFDFDRAGGRMPAGWTLSRFNAKVSLTLKHTASGRTVQITDTTPTRGVTDFPLTWNGLYDDGLPAYNGAYTWTMRAEPANGIGPAVERTGAFTLTRAPRPHDFDGNGSPDVLHRSDSGHLSSYDLRQVWSLHPGDGQSIPSYDMYTLPIGGGWQAYDRIVPTGDTGGTRDADLVARDRSGVLWLYQGKGTPKAPFAPRTPIGGGWQVYDKLTGGSDLTGDGRNDLLATDRSGVLWLYPGTGNATAPFKPRVKAGTGWGIYNQLTAVGNIAGGAGGDLVARDRDGVLWLYLGKGDGTFTARTRVGGGWQHFEEIIGVGDVDGDGLGDVVGTDKYADYGTKFALRLYRGTAQRTEPFAPGQYVGSLWADGRLY